MNMQLLAGEAIRQTMRYLSRQAKGKRYTGSAINFVMTAGHVETAHGKVTIRLLSGYALGSFAMWQRLLNTSVGLGLVERIEGINPHWRLTGKGWQLRNNYIEKYEERYKKLVEYYQKLGL
jgi:hypothetical protein